MERAPFAAVSAVSRLGKRRRVGRHSTGASLFVLADIGREVEHLTRGIVGSERARVLEAVAWGDLRGGTLRGNSPTALLEPETVVGEETGKSKS